MTSHNSWDSAARARVSNRWVAASANWNNAITDALIAEAALNRDSVVLDLAAGSGDPALSMAQRLGNGRVIAIDSSLGGLLLAKRQAPQLGLGSKLACIQGDAHAIPLARNSVDCVTCRFGMMFFEDTARVLADMLRVLKPGGRVALLVWGPPEQPFFDATVGVVMRLVLGAEMPPASMQMFRFSALGSLEQYLRAAGFCEVRENLMELPRVWAGTPQELWEYQQEVSTLCHPLFASIPSNVKPQVDATVSAELSRFQTGGLVTVPVKVSIVGGRKADALASPKLPP